MELPRPARPPALKPTTVLCRPLRRPLALHATLSLTTLSLSLLSSAFFSSLFPTSFFLPLPNYFRQPIRPPRSLSAGPRRSNPRTLCSPRSLPPTHHARISRTRSRSERLQRRPDESHDAHSPLRWTPKPAEYVAHDLEKHRRLRPVVRLTEFLIDTSHVPCKFFRQGACQAGNACPFSHDLGAASETICKYFAKVRYIIPTAFLRLLTLLAIPTDNCLCYIGKL